MENQTHSVTISFEKGKYAVSKALEVSPGDRVEFSSPNSNAKISFPDSGIINITGWETIEKGSSIKKIVEPSAANGTYYYAVLCEHDNEEYWYAEGNSCPAMKVGG